MTLCSRCKKERDSSEFQKGGRQLKTCAKCREKRSKVEVVVQRTVQGPEYLKRPEWRELFHKFWCADQEGEPFAMAEAWKEVRDTVGEEVLAQFREDQMRNCCEVKRERFRQMYELLPLLE